MLKRNVVERSARRLLRQRGLGPGRVSHRRADRGFLAGADRR